MTTTSAHLEQPSDRTAGIDRRQLMKAGAWAAPALLVTVAAPAAMASDPPVPPDVVAVPNGGTNFLPKYLFGATAITDKSYWSTYTDPGNPNRVGSEVNISGIPQAGTARSVSLYYYVPTAAGALGRTAPNPSLWQWAMGGSNFSSMNAVYSSISPTTGLWRLDFILPSWGTTSYAHLFVTFPG